MFIFLNSNWQQLIANQPDLEKKLTRDQPNQRKHGDNILLFLIIVYILQIFLNLNVTFVVLCRHEFIIDI